MNYKSESLNETFYPMHKFTYQDETFYLSGSDRLSNGVQPEKNVVLLDVNMMPLSLLPMDLPTEMDDIVSNHSSPTLKRINDTVAISF